MSGNDSDYDDDEFDDNDDRIYSDSKVTSYRLLKEVGTKVEIYRQ